MEQRIGFLDTDHGRVAFANVGDGPPLMLGCWWVGNLELQWESVSFRAWIERLAVEHTVLWYDRPGTGLSTPGRVDLSVADEAAVSSAVLEAVDVGPAALFGASSAGCAAVALAATRPDLVTRLALYGAYANGDELTTNEVRDSLVGLVEAHWGLGSTVIADIFMPDADAHAREDFARFQRQAMTAAHAATCLRQVFRMEAGPWLGDVTVPTLVVHRRGDRAIPIEQGRTLAARIPGARFVALPGRDHFPWVGDVDGVLRTILPFLGAAAPPSPEAADNPLSDREREVLALVALGLSDAEIAGELVVSPHTVHRHVANVRRKLLQPSRAAAVAEASRRGWL